MFFLNWLDGSEMSLSGVGRVKSRPQANDFGKTRKERLSRGGRLAALGKVWRSGGFGNAFRVSRQDGFCQRDRLQIPIKTEGLDLFRPPRGGGSTAVTHGRALSFRCFVADLRDLRGSDPDENKPSPVSRYFDTWKPVHKTTIPDSANDFPTFLSRSGAVG